MASLITALGPRTAAELGLILPHGLLELTAVFVAGGIGLLVPATRVAAAICLVVFLVAVFPANAYAAGKTERFGAFATPLVPRAIVQVVLIALCVFCAL